MTRAEGKLKTRLGELARERRSVGPADGATPAALAATRNASTTTGVEAFLAGGEWRDEQGAVFVHERLRSDVEKRRPHWGTLGAPPPEEADLVALASLGLERALFLDLETGGLSSSPVFLAGTMHWNGEDFVLRQYFARHYGEEPALLRALGEATREFDMLITFNGKSYDAPFLRDRALVHGERITLPPRHLDLLHASRRATKVRGPAHPAIYARPLHRERIRLEQRHHAPAAE
jgi:hypothetical protein